MAILCPACGRQYDVTLFQFGRTVRCECGRMISEAGHTISASGSASGSAPGSASGSAGAGCRERPGPAREEIPERAAMEELARGADRVVDLIMGGECSRVDILIAADRLRERCGELFPEGHEVFFMVYESWFARLYRQFRGGVLWEEGPAG